MVVREPALPHRIAIALPLAEERQAYRWRLQRESGAEDRGECVPADLEAAGHCDLDSQAFVRRVLPLEMPVEPGYHRFLLERADGQGEPAEMPLIVAPAACYQPPAIQGEGRAWGFAAQLYGVRSERNWHRRLRDCATIDSAPVSGPAPCCSIRCTPFSRRPRARSPTVLPAVRLPHAVPRLEAIADFADGRGPRDGAPPQFQARLRALRPPRRSISRCGGGQKADLECLVEHFRSEHLERDSERRRLSRLPGGRCEGLRKSALFEALQEQFHGQDSRLGLAGVAEPIATRTPPSGRCPRSPSGNGWSNSNTCSGRRPGSWPRRHPLVERGSASA